ncbi:hypothetical protein ACHAXT_010594 [Thalassiosira profunda]
MRALGLVAAAACGTCPASALALSGFQVPAPTRHRKKAHISCTQLQWRRCPPGTGIERGAAASSRLLFAKRAEDVIEREPIISSEDIESIDALSYTNGASTDGALGTGGTTNGGRALGILVLLTVPLAWGTYTPVVKYMYERLDPSMPGFVFSAGYYLVAAASLGILSSMQNDPQNGTLQSGTMQTGEDAKEEGYDATITTRGGWELGSYLFVGNGLQVVGLQTVPADRAAFLVQLTTVMVPLLSALTAGTLSAVPLQTWAACIVAFAGVVIMGADDAGSESIGSFDVSQLSISQGDFLIVLAAVAYSLHVVRLGAYAPRTTPLKLAASKATTEAILSVTLVIALAFIGTTHLTSPEFVSQTGSSVSGYFQTMSSGFREDGLAGGKDSALGVSIGAILWTGWVTCAYTIYAQSFGQSRVNPTDSNLIYTTQPLFSSMFAYVLLGETLGVYGFAGAILIGTALWLVTVSEDR